MQLLTGLNAIFGVQMLLMALILVIFLRFYLEYNINLTRKIELLLHISAFVWGLLYILEIMVPEYILKNTFFRLTFMNKASFGTLILLYAVSQYNKKWLSRNNIIALFLCNVGLFAFFLTNDYHNLAWVYSHTVDVENFSLLINDYRLGYYLIYGLNYALIAVSIALFTKAIIDTRNTSVTCVLQPVLMASMLLYSAYYNFSLGAAAVDYSSLGFIVLSIVISVSKPTTSNIYEVFTTSRGIIFDRMNDAIILLNPEGKLVDMNSYAKNVFADEEKFMSTINELTNQSNDDWKNLWVRYWHTGLERSEVNFNNRIFDVSAYPIFNKGGGIAAQVLVLKDITERKNLEKSLRSYSERLEEVVEERSKKLKDAERLAGIGETTAMVGHDLRNPLQAISGIFNIFKERYNNEDDVLMVNRIERNLNYMNKIVSDLQSYAKPITLNLEKINVRNYIDKVVSTLIVPENITVVIDIPPEGELLLDHNLFERVLNNMIMNSIQAMPDGGKIVIKSEEEGDYVLVHVMDEGVGIPDEVKARIFTPLFTTKAKGTGLGLAVCKRIIEAHDGLISFKPNTGKGTVFTIKLPLSNVSVSDKAVLKESQAQVAPEPVGNNGK